MHFFIAMDRHPDACKDQEGSKQVNDPVEFLQKHCTDGNQSPAHDQSPKNAPKQNTVLINSWHSKEGKDQHKDEYIVNAERFFDQVACEESQRGFTIGITAGG